MDISYVAAEMSDDFERSVRLGAEAGVSVVSIRSKAWGKALEDLSDDEVAKMRKILARYDMRVGMLLSPVGKCEITDDAAFAQHEEILQRTIRLAYALNTDAIRVFPFRPPNPTPFRDSRFEEYRARITERWEPWLRVTEDAGVQLCFEWVGTTLVLTCEQMRQVVDDLGAPDHVGVIWEIDVAAQAGESPEAGHPHIRGLIRDTHIKRFDGGATREQYETAVRLLSADGYDSSLTVEHWGGEKETLDGITQVTALRSVA
ncbi:MAG: TIM barrel protein [Candidatus Poribacteria bacterium]